MTHEDLCPPEDLYLNGHYSFIYSNQKLRRNQMSINWWPDKQIML